LRVVFAVPSFSVVPWLVAERGGIGTLPMSVAARYAPLLDLAIVEPPFRLPSAQLAMIWHERSEADEGQRWFRSALASVARGVAVARPHRNGRT
jgi:DNA-binding transcriptional LysR family regulator